MTSTAVGAVSPGGRHVTHTLRRVSPQGSHERRASYTYELTPCEEETASARKRRRDRNRAQEQRATTRLDFSLHKQYCDYESARKRRSKQPAPVDVDAATMEPVFAVADATAGAAIERSSHAMSQRTRARWAAAEEHMLRGLVREAFTQHVLPYSKRVDVQQAIYDCRPFPSVYLPLSAPSGQILLHARSDRSDGALTRRYGRTLQTS